MNWFYTLTNRYISPISFLLLFLFYSTTAHADCPNNLLSNASFENSSDPLSGWSLNLGTVETSNDAFTGNNAALLTGYEQAELSEALPAEEGKRYTFTAMAKMTGSVVIEAQIRIKFLDSNWQPIDFANGKRIKLNSEYEEYSTKDISPAGTAYVQVAVYKRFGNGFVWLDDLCLTESDNDSQCDPAIDAPQIFRCPGLLTIYTEDTSAEVFWSLPGQTCQPNDVSFNSHNPGDVFPLGLTTVTVTRTNFLGLASTCSFDVNVIQIDAPDCNADLLTNGDFENGFDGWDGNINNLTSLTSDATNGANAALQGTVTLSELSQTFPATAGETYTMKAQAKKSGLISLQAGFSFIFLDAQMNFIKASSMDIRNVNPFSGDFVPLIWRDVTPANTAFIKVAIQKQQGNSDFTFDDVCLTKSTTTPPNGPCANNLLANSGFELSNTDITNWTPTTTPLVHSISNDAFSGNNALLMGGSVYAKVAQTVPASPGDIFTISAQIKAVAQNHLLRIRFRDANDNIISTYQEAEPYTGNYQETSITTIGAPNNTASVSAVILKLPNSGDVLVDDFCLTNNSSTNPCNPDYDPPSFLACPDNINRVIPIGANSVSVSWSPILAEDDCGAVNLVSSSHDSGDDFTVGNTLVTAIYADEAGNTAECSFIVNVSQESSNTCVNNLLDNPGYEANDQDPTSWSETGNNSFSISNDAYSGDNAVLVSGSSSGGILQSAPAIPGQDYTVSAQVKQDENIGRLRLRFLTASYQPIQGSSYTTSPSANGQYQEFSISFATAPANAAFVFVSLEKTSSTTGSFLVDDWCLTGSSNNPCNPDVTGPTISNCPEDITITTSNTGENVSWTSPTASDQCGSATITSPYSSGSFFPIGVFVITYTATDQSGNTSTCDFLINVVDNNSSICPDNLLDNPGFENSNSSFPDWNATGGGNYTISNDARTGTNALQISGPFSNGVVQNVPAEAGMEFTTTVHIKQSENVGFLRMKFLSATYQPLAQNTQSNIATGEYQALTLTEVAPANTAFVEVGIYKTAATDGSFVIDDWCLTSSSMNGSTDLSLANFDLPANVEAGKGTTFSMDAINSSNATVPAEELLLVNVYLSTDANIDSNDPLIGSYKLEDLTPGSTAIEVPLFIPSDTDAGQTYYFLPSIDPYNVIDESNENNNDYTFVYYIYENSGSPCAKNFALGNYYTCAEHLPSGNLRVVTALAQSPGPIYFENIINEAGEIISSDATAGPGTPGGYEVVNGNLNQLNAFGVVIGTTPLSADLLAKNNLQEEIMTFDNGFIFFNLVATNILEVIKTDDQLNIVFLEPIFTNDFISRVESLVKLESDRFAFVYNELTGFQGSNQSTLVVMNPDLDLISSEVISSLNGSVSSAVPSDLEKNSCGLWRINSSGGTAGGGGGGISLLTESTGYYTFSNDEFTLVKRYSETDDLTYSGGNQSFTKTRSFVGLDDDGNTLRATRSYNVSNYLPPSDYIPANEELFLTKETPNGTILWSKTLSPAEVYPFTELVQIGDNYFLLNGGTYTNVDCDNNLPNIPTTGVPVDCEVSSNFPWHEWISNVSFANLNNSSAKSTYSDFTNVGSATLFPGQSLSLAVDATISYFAEDLYFSVYIDFNGNDLFEESELTSGGFTNLDNGSNVTYTWNGSISVPADAAIGEHKMRIIMSRDNMSSGACDDISFGEIEDYSVDVVAISNYQQEEESVEIPDGVNLFPNPAQQYVNVDISDFQRQNINIEVVNNLGQSMYNSDIIVGLNKYNRIDLSGWTNGYYLVWIKPENGSRRVGKLIVVQTY